MQVTLFNFLIIENVSIQVLSSISDGSHDTYDAVTIGFCPISYTVYTSILIPKKKVLYIINVLYVVLNSYGWFLRYVEIM